MELQMLEMILSQTGSALAPIALFLYFYFKGKKEEKDIVTSYNIMSKKSKDNFESLEIKLLKPVEKLSLKMDSIDTSVNDLSVIVKNLVIVSDMETEAFLYKTRLQETAKVKLAKLNGNVVIKTFLEFKVKAVIDLSYSISIAIAKSIHIKSDSKIEDITNSIKSNGTISVEEVNGKAKELLEDYFLKNFYIVHEPLGRNHILSLNRIAIDNENNKMSRINTLTVNFILNFIDSINLLYYKYLVDREQSKKLGAKENEKTKEQSKTKSEIFRDNLSRG